MSGKRALGGSNQPCANCAERSLVVLRATSFGMTPPRRANRIAAFLIDTEAIRNTRNLLKTHNGDQL